VQKRFDNTCDTSRRRYHRTATLARVQLTGPNHAPFIVVEVRPKADERGAVTFQWRTLKKQLGYDTKITERGDPLK
jgi:hypothetical protein